MKLLAGTVSISVSLKNEKRKEKKRKGGVGSNFK